MGGRSVRPRGGWPNDSAAGDPPFDDRPEPVPLALRKSHVIAVPRTDPPGCNGGPQRGDLIVTLHTALKAELRDQLGPAARRHGYRGSAPTWRKTNAQGDWVVVNVQSSSWNTSERIRCTINIAAVPEPWLRWMRHQLDARPVKSVSESHGLYRDRLHPTGAPDGADLWWEAVDASSIEAMVADMTARLEDVGWNLLDLLLTREGIRRRLEDGNHGLFKRASVPALFKRAEALLLMDDGPSNELDACLAYALEGAMPGQRENSEAFDSWVRTQAEAALAR
ncbi:DUF4304 domain-containing protein [Agromyces sp. NPDC058126]|uniref:DUF4304 domain-containing protein n=1 Tax=Agromyces sp. NPDC058126 TaxID=3346350 RepID=UPI0036D920BF